LFPGSPTFALVYNRKNAHADFRDKDIRTSFIQKLPFGVRAYEWFLMMMPTATEHYDLTDYDLIVSSTSFSAKGVITPPDAKHICYCHTPTRFLWTDSHNYFNELKYNIVIKKLLPFMLPRLRLWDRIAAERVDHFIANSQEVKKRIKKYYNQDSEVIYPPVETDKFRISEEVGDYFLAGGRLVGYKRFDLLVKAFNRLNIPLKIFGDGPLMDRLKNMAKSNIEFLGKISEEEKIELYSKCLAYLNPQIEDFGITAIEAMASGRPVIALRKGGALETIVEGRTGVFFEDQTWEDLADKVIRFDREKWNPDEIKQHAEQFDVGVFKEKMREFVKEKVSGE